MTFSSVYGGEDWDARLEQKGWDRADFDGSKWSPVDTLAGPGGALKGVGRGAPPVRAFEVHRPVGEKSVKPNVAIYDLGQNASHVTRFTVSGPAGSAVRVTPSELLTETGVLFRNNYNGRAFSQYTLTGTGKETYTAKFYYCGCRYLQVECLPADGGSEAPRVDAIEGVVVHSDAPQTGQFSCSNDLFNRIFAMIRWAELSNMMSVISDCPHRERLGWLEQDHLHGPSFRYNYDMTPTFAKIIGDVADCQLESGLVPTTAPEYPTFSAKWRDAIEWGSSGVLLPWQQYQWTGDLDELRRSYPMMKRYVGYLTGRAKGGISAPGLGDWVGNGPSKATPNDLIATALYYHDADVLARVARLLGHADDAEATERLAAGIKAAFNAAYFRPETGQYGTGSQCANAMALALGLAAPADRPAVLKNLVTDLETRRYELTVGEVGMQYMLRALADGGRSDVVFALANQSDKPGYGYMLKMGATALCECWDAARDNSQNQFMHGHIVEWYYHDLAGIQSDPEVAGSKQVAIRPNVVGDLTEVKGRCNTARGVVASEWRRDGRSLKMRVVIPPNMMATVRVPAEKNTPVTEGGKPAAEAAGVKQVVATGTYAEYHIGSGEYEFQSRLP